MQTVQHEKRPENKSKVVLLLPSTLLTAILQNMNSIKINKFKKMTGIKKTRNSKFWQEYPEKRNMCFIKD